MNHIESIKDPGLAWCGDEINTLEFYYKSVDNAVMAGFIPDSKPPCSQCVHMCIQLLNNFEDNND